MMPERRDAQLNRDAAGQDVEPVEGAGAAVETGGAETEEWPREVALLPLRNTVVFPFTFAPIQVGRASSRALIDEEVTKGHLIGVVTQVDPSVEDPGQEDLQPVGCLATVMRLQHRRKEGLVDLVLHGLDRFRIGEVIGTRPYLRARVERFEEEIRSPEIVEALRRTASNLFRRALGIEEEDQVPAAVAEGLGGAEHPGRVADLIGASIPLGTAERYEILETPDVEKRLRTAMGHLNRELQVREVRQQLESKAHGELDRRGREALLREQLKAIRQELGDEDEQTALADELRAKVEEAHMPEEPHHAALREIGRLESMAPASPEFSVARTYVEVLASLPWSVSTDDAIDLEQVRKILDEDHEGLSDVKERILELLAVFKLKKEVRGTVLCLVGPPGVGKTSLGRSIARAMGRRFVRISLGGVRDEAEIRGHRRTYVGALPGRIIQGMKQAASNNPVFLLDEVDKLGADFRGDPSSALLEVLDPAQNSTFSDHYLEVPFDLSRVLFIATANQLGPIPAALEDRMEVIPLSGYTEDEKVAIARHHLLPRQIEAAGLAPEQLKIPDETLLRLIRDYTRESGVRTLERTLGGVCRKTARRVVEQRGPSVTVMPEDLRQYLGPPRFFHEEREKELMPGTATGLAWTPAGGEVLFLEAVRMEGRPDLILTGQLGDVMKESARIALSCVRSRATELGIDPGLFEHSQIHLHVPAGAVPKDGPSAGVAMAVALASLLSGRPTRPDIAMTGEITLRGRVMPVGGIKEKVLAAIRADISTVIVPTRNAGDIEKIAGDIRERVTIVQVDALGPVFERALASPPRTSDV